MSGINDLGDRPPGGSVGGLVDIDTGSTSVQSPAIVLPSSGNLTLTFSYYLAHTSNSSTADYLRVTIVGATTAVVLQELGAANNDDAVWSAASVNLNAFAGQTIRIRVDAADAGREHRGGRDRRRCRHDDGSKRRAQLHQGRESDRERGWRRAAGPGGPPRSSAGPADEAGQALDFIVSNNNTALFSVQPAVAANGTLTYTPAANASGAATVTVQLHDNGGTANGGADTSGEQTFDITVTTVNDVPSFTSGADRTVSEDAGAQSVIEWATAISAGPSTNPLRR